MESARGKLSCDEERFISSPPGAAPSQGLDEPQHQTVLPHGVDNLGNLESDSENSDLCRHSPKTDSKSFQIKEQNKGGFYDDKDMCCYGNPDYSNSNRTVVRNNSNQYGNQSDQNVEEEESVEKDPRIPSTQITDKTKTLSSGRVQSPSKLHENLTAQVNEKPERNLESTSSMKTKTLKRKIDGTDKSTSSQKTNMKPIVPKLDPPAAKKEVETSATVQSPRMLHNVLNQKKMALMRSPEVMEFLQQHQMKRATAPPRNKDTTR